MLSVIPRNLSAASCEETMIMNENVFLKPEITSGEFLCEKPRDDMKVEIEKIDPILNRDELK